MLHTYDATSNSIIITITGYDAYHIWGASFNSILRFGVVFVINAKINLSLRLKL